MYHMNLKELTVGQPITGYYILRSGKTVTTSEGKSFYCATVLDGSGTMDVFGFTDEEMERYRQVVESTAHLIMRFAQEGGFDGAASF